MPYLMGGFPDAATATEIGRAYADGGADLVELGVPFSDPLADGPVIQRASERALRAGVTLEAVLQLVRRIRRTSALPIVLFSYVNPLLRFGLRRLAGEAAAAGVDGVLVTDLPPEESDEWLRVARTAPLDTIFLASPTSPDDRLRRVAEASRGFVYAISRTGVTGEQQRISDDARPLLDRLRGLTGEPIALGFGISTPAQVAEAAAAADAVVVGSALVRFVEEQPAGDVAEKVRWLKSAM